MVRSLLRLWALSLMLSAVLAAAGDRWPQPLPIVPAVVALLVLLPPLLVLVWLGFHWRLPTPPEGGGTGERGESQNYQPREL
jgi:hypothetical protein